MPKRRRVILTSGHGLVPCKYYSRKCCGIMGVAPQKCYQRQVGCGKDCIGMIITIQPGGGSALVS